MNNPGRSQPVNTFKVLTFRSGENVVGADERLHRLNRDAVLTLDTGG